MWDPDGECWALSYHVNSKRLGAAEIVGSRCTPVGREGGRGGRGGGGEGRGRDDPIFIWLWCMYHTTYFQLKSTGTPVKPRDTSLERHAQSYHLPCDFTYRRPTLE